MSKNGLIKNLVNQKVAITTKGDALTDEIGTITEIRENFVGFLVSSEAYGHKETLKLWVSIDEIAVLTELGEDLMSKNPRLAQIKRIK